MRGKVTYKGRAKQNYKKEFLPIRKNLALDNGRSTGGQIVFDVLISINSAGDENPPVSI